MKLSTAATLALGFAAALPFPATAQFGTGYTPWQLEQRRQFEAGIAEHRQRQFEADTAYQQQLMQHEQRMREYDTRQQMMDMERRMRSRDDSRSFGYPPFNIP